MWDLMYIKAPGPGCVGANVAQVKSDGAFSKKFAAGQRFDFAIFEAIGGTVLTSKGP